MSISRKLMAVISLIIVVLLVSNFVLSIVNARQYFSEQMQALTEDAATSLGFSLSHAAQEGDEVIMESMVDVIFDRGYYRSIVLTNIEGKVLAARSRDIAIEGVPEWFIQLIDIPPSAGLADVVAGWNQLGEVTIIAHPGYAYRELWRVMMSQTWLFLFAAVLCYGLAGVAMKHFLKPLVKVEQQAQAISRKDFVEQKDLPSSPEFRRIVVAMNYMSVKVREMFQRQVDLTDSYRRDANMDALTQLPNREEFNRQFSAWLQSEESGVPGALLIGQVNNLTEINNELGRERANALLVGIAEHFRQALGDWPRALASRRTGSDFVLFIPAMLPGELEKFLQGSKQKLNALLAELSLDDNAFILGAAVSAKVENLSGLLSAADAALRKSLTANGTLWEINIEPEGSAHRQASEWVDILQSMIKRREVSLVFQPVFDQNKKVISHEVLARFNEAGKLVSAGVFWPIAERFHLVEQLDRLIIEEVMLVLQQHEHTRLTVNISPQSLDSEEFIRWLATSFASCDAVSRLSLELPERVLRMNMQALQKLCHLSTQHSVSIGLDHFGHAPSSLGVLQKLPLSYVKVDRRFVHDVSNQGFYLKTLAQIANTCDVLILAEGVETEEQWNESVRAGLAGGQGFWLAKPEDTIPRV